MVKHDQQARVEMWVSEFPTYSDHIWEWTVRRFDPLSGRMKEFAYGKESSREIAQREAEKTFEFCGGRL